MSSLHFFYHQWLSIHNCSIIVSFLFSHYIFLNRYFFCSNKNIKKQFFSLSKHHSSLSSFIILSNKTCFFHHRHLLLSYSSSQFLIFRFYYSFPPSLPTFSPLIFYDSYLLRFLSTLSHFYF